MSFADLAGVGAACLAWRRSRKHYRAGRLPQPGGAANGLKVLLREDILNGKRRS